MLSRISPVSVSQKFADEVPKTPTPDMIGSATCIVLAFFGVQEVLAFEGRKPCPKSACEKTLT